MKWFINLRLRQKLLVAFGLVLALMIAQSSFAYASTVQSTATTSLVAQRYQTVGLAKDILKELLNMQTGYRGFLLTGKDEFLEPYDSGRLAYTTTIQEIQQKGAHSPEAAQRWKDLAQHAAEWQRDITERGIQLRRDVTAGRAAQASVEAFVASGGGKESFDTMRALIQAAIDEEQAELRAKEAEQNAAAKFLEQVILWGTLGTLILSILIASMLARYLTGAVGRMSHAATRIAAGDVDQQLDVYSRDELGQMADAFRAMIAYENHMAAAANAIAEGDLSQDVRPQSERDVLGGAFQRMLANLRELVAELQHGSSNLASASSEILAAASQQASGATEQSAAIAETTATVAQVKTSAEHSVQMAEAVADASRQANEVANEGVAALSHATAGMNGIRQKVQLIAENMLALSEQSQQIGEIITTVSDLADQSNMLALNAAIEASRAGEHGRGFAVVAQEIRNLAEQSKAATAQVRTILSDIQRATNAAVMATEQGTSGADTGAVLIEQASHTIDEISSVVQHGAQLAAQIAASVRQHSIGMEQIAEAMSNINEATAQSLMATTDTQHSAQNLTELAGRLKQVVTQYQL